MKRLLLGLVAAAAFGVLPTVGLFDSTAHAQYGTSRRVARRTSRRTSARYSSGYGVIPPAGVGYYAGGAAVAGAAVGAAAIASVPYGAHYVTTLPAGCTTVVEGDVTVQSCSGSIYRPYYQGEDIVYVKE